MIKTWYIKPLWISRFRRCFALFSFPLFVNESTFVGKVVSGTATSMLTSYFYGSVFSHYFKLIFKLWDLIFKWNNTSFKDGQFILIWWQCGSKKALLNFVSSLKMMVNRPAHCLCSQSLHNPLQKIASCSSLVLVCSTMTLVPIGQNIDHLYFSFLLSIRRVSLSVSVTLSTTWWWLSIWCSHKKYIVLNIVCSKLLFGLSKHNRWWCQKM